MVCNSYSKRPVYMHNATGKTAVIEATFSLFEKIIEVHVLGILQ